MNKKRGSDNPRFILCPIVLLRCFEQRKPYFKNVLYRGGESKP